MKSDQNTAITVNGRALERLPDCAGVYRFFSENGSLLYVGKSINILQRIRGHHTEARARARHARLMNGVARIDCQPTAGELGALLKESEAVKNERPLYNRRLRRRQNLWSLQLETDEQGFLVPHVTAGSPARAEDWQECRGLFNSKQHCESTLRTIATENGLCPQVLRLERGRGPCFQHQVRRCRGACAGKESCVSHNQRLLNAISRLQLAAWPYGEPVLIREFNRAQHPLAPRVEWHLVHNWSYLGTGVSAAEARKLCSQSPRVVFDRDSYHILLAALRSDSVEVRSLGHRCPALPNLFAAA